MLSISLRGSDIWYLLRNLNLPDLSLHILWHLGAPDTYDFLSSVFVHLLIESNFIKTFF